MADEGYTALRVVVAGGIARVTLDHPPVNLLDRTLFGELARVGAELADDDAVRVVVVDSADPEFWIAHFDVEAILEIPLEVPPEVSGGLGSFDSMCDRFRTMGKPTVALIEGRARGGGSELALAFDLRYGALGRTVLGQPEVPLGILPGGGATQRLPRLIGRSRALEVILGGDDVDAETAERWGWLTRAFPPDELRPFVDALAARLATLPPEAVALAKASVDAGLPPLEPGLRHEDHLFRRANATDEAQRRMRRFLDLGGQTPDVERDLGPWIADALADR